MKNFDVLKQFIVEALHPSTREVRDVYVSEPIYFEDGKLSFWQVKVGIMPTASPTFSKNLNSLFARNKNWIMWDRKFSSPYKRLGGLRINSINSAEFDPIKNESVGRSLHQEILAMLQNNGYTIKPFP